MENIKEERKKYPSEINTKSIACRIPIYDYVEIMNECINKGIKINDWLLMKLYNKNTDIQISDQEEAPPKFPEFTIETFRGFFTFQDEEDVENTINHLINENIMLQRNINQNTEINIDSKEMQTRIFLALIDKINKIEWDSVKDKILVKRDLKDLWKSLFD